MRRIYSVAIFIITVFLIAGCNTTGIGVHAGGPVEKNRSYQKQGPPPHAPAHGYRHKHQDGRQLVFDTSIGAYVVIGLPDTYFNSNLYLRLSDDGRWMVSLQAEDGWRPAKKGEVPQKLMNSKNKKKRSKKNKKNKHWE
eukprot:Anaeramoba_ignava/a610878_11.p2 GENE.a610878_11~~a610878_11.p2  ORF type:complete len:139 (-),score=4.37 a610878_11:988-1404(-)